MQMAHVGPSGSELAPSTFEAFVKVPNVLRPHTQIFCTSEWVLGTREDLVKDIVAELRPDLGEVRANYVLLNSMDNIHFLSTTSVLALNLCFRL
jgi:hypothetical protein